jgi:hypothetical protein
MSKILVLFVFHIYNYRVKHFIDTCIFKDDNIDFVVICNNKNINFKVPNYVTKIVRDNIGYDFGGWSDALLKNDLYKQYDKFIFVNSSVYRQIHKLNNTYKWTDLYINGLKDNIKLFGNTINTCLDPLNTSHVQSYLFAMDKNTLQYLIYCGIFSITHYVKEFHDAIVYKEIRMSRKIIEHGWNIGSLLLHYKDVDFTFKSKKPHEYHIRFLNDIMYPEFVHVHKLNDLEFIKGNRFGIGNQVLIPDMTKLNKPQFKKKDIFLKSFQLDIVNNNKKKRKHDAVKLVLF